MALVLRDVRGCGAAILSCALLGVALAAALVASSPAAQAAEPFYSEGQPIVVTLDQAKVLKLPERTSTLVVGNPIIADVSVQAGGTMVVTGKGYGITNLIALDRAGAVLFEHSIQVQGPRERLVVVHRGVDRETYSCTPTCERRVTLGDTPAYFTATLTQTGTLNSQAQSSAQAAK
jgi:hypothetical protein